MTDKDKELADKLKDSIVVLSEMIENTFSKAIDPTIKGRLVCYQEMVEKAKLIVDEIYWIMYTSNNKEEISQKLKHINGISLLIKEDALQLLNGETKNYDA